MNQSLISIIVPVYNVEQYLRKCLDSIVHQTYNNLEIILVDDGSTDSCGTICDEYAVEDERIHVIHQLNRGLSAARNAGLDLAKGEYVLFVDSDDWIEHNTCEIALSIAKEQHVDIVCFGYKEIFPSGMIKTNAVNCSAIMPKIDLISQLILGKGVIRDYAWNKFVSRKIYNGVRFPEGKTFEDICVSYLLIHKVEIVYVTNIVLYNYIRRKNSLASNYWNINSLNDRMYAYNCRLDFLQKQYVELVDMQLSIIMRELLIAREKKIGGLNIRQINEEVKQFARKYKGSRKQQAKYSRIVWFYYYCRPLTSLFLKIRQLILGNEEI